MEKLLVGIHGGLAMLTGRGEWALDTESRIFDGKTEAEFMAQSIKDVAQHYGGIADQKTLDWFNLSQCLAIVWGGRIYTIRANPRARAVRAQPSVQETAATHSPVPPRTATVPPVNEFNFSPDTFEHTPATHGHVAGIGDIELPDDHPLSPNYKPKWN